jgi:hypothetical protein
VIGALGDDDDASTAEPADDDTTVDPGDDDDESPEHVGGPGDPSDAIFAGKVVHEFDIQLNEASWNALVASPFEWVEASILYDGEEYGPLGVRLKGQNSFQPLDSKPAFKIKFDWIEDDATFLGLKRLTLNNMWTDWTMIHERVAYRLYREAGVPAVRSAHAWVRVNGEPYGLYALLESEDRQFVGRWFDDDEGSFFEVWDVDFYDAYIPYFEWEFGEDDRTNLQGVADALESSGPGAIQNVREHLDLDGFLQYWAVGAFVGQFDAYPYSYPGDDCSVYDDRETGVLHFIPHGMDEAFAGFENPVDWVNGIIASRCLGVSSCREDWIQRIAEVSQLAEEIDLLATADEAIELIEPYVQDDPRMQYSASDIAWGQEDLRNWVLNRREQLEDQLGAF